MRDLVRLLCTECNEENYYTDKNKKKYKKLSASDYMIIESQSMIVLSSSANAGRREGKTPEILVTFNSNADLTAVKTASTSFIDDMTEPKSPGEEPLFNKDSVLTIDNLETTIDGSPALIIQHPVKLSPYLCASFYDLGITQDSDISVIYKNSEKEVSEYSIDELTENFSSVKDDFFSENHKFARLSSVSSTKTSLQLAENRFPLAKADACLLKKQKNLFLL